MSEEEFVWLQKTEEMVKAKFAGEGSGHDWWHIKRVHDVALHLAEGEGADRFITAMGAWLHDIADHKFHGGDYTVGPATARRWMEELGCRAHDISHVVDIVSQVSFKGAQVETPMSSIEGACVQDADRLDAIGAIGIARCFAYGGHVGHSLYTPDEGHEAHTSFEDYMKSEASSIGHFYEKLLLLKDRMNTTTGQTLAEKRHSFMENFLEEFYAEWKGKR
jgi:uncharacterized protein